MKGIHERRVFVSDEEDVAGFRQHARQLLAEGVEPERVVWQVATAASGDLFEDGSGKPPSVQTDGGDGRDRGAGAAGKDGRDGVVSGDGGGDGAAGGDALVTAPAQAVAAPAAPIKVPAFFVALCEHAGLHADPGRFGLLYRLLWRLVHEPGLRDDALDPDRLEAEKMARMVRRDMHKMTAFVRFRPIGGGDVVPANEVEDASAAGIAEPSTKAAIEPAPSAASAPVASFAASPARADASTALDTNASLDGGVESPADPDSDSQTNAEAGAASDAGAVGKDPRAEAEPADPAHRWHVAWFEPVHHIVAATAPFFARRFAQLKWAILTPERCVRWDGASLAFSPGAKRDEAPPADAGEQLWLTYYAHIFNPARLKLAMMQKEMPRRYWHNLPEAALIQPLTAAASRQSEQMVAQSASSPTHRRPAASLAMRIDSRAAAATSASSSSSSTSSPLPTDLTLPTLGEALNACRECPIGALATQAVPGGGPPQARLMLVGEQPGDQEDLRGQAFVGPAGQLLDRAFKALGWPRDALYVTNAVKHFKYELRGQRRIHKTPSQREAAACLHWLESEIDLVQPQAVIALGATAARSLLGRAIGVNAERGRWLARADGLRVLITLHPSALLRMEPGDREAAFQAWLTDLSAANGQLATAEPPPNS